MSEEPPKYSDPGEQVDFKVTKSYGRASRSILSNKVYYVATIVIIVGLTYFMTFAQTAGIRETLETKVNESEKRITELETKVTELETKVTELETKINKKSAGSSTPPKTSTNQ